MAKQGPNFRSRQPSADINHNNQFINTEELRLEENEEGQEEPLKNWNEQSHFTSSSKQFY